MYNKVIVKVIEKGKYMKVQTNKKYTTIAFYAVIVIAINVLLVVAVFKFNTILKLISTLVSALTPVIVGLVIAFLINPINKTATKNIARNFFKEFSIIPLSPPRN